MRFFRYMCVALCLAAGQALAVNLSLEPYIQNLNAESVEILWRTDEAAGSWVEVTPADGGEAIVYTSTVPVTKHQMPVPGLDADTKYTYRVGVSADNVLSEVHGPFQTFPTESETFDFVAYGDHRNYPDDHRAVTEAIIAQAEERGWPRFVLDSGDYTGLGEHPTDFYKEQFFDPARGLIDRVCLFPVIGNHEAARKHPRIPFRYFDYFEVPTENSGTEYYYSFDYGTAHFTMIDVYATDFSEGSKQWEWIRQDLKDSDAKWKFTVMHYPIYIHRSGPTVTYGNTEIREHLVPLFEKYGVTAAISGDSHFYQRSEVNGVHYVCTGGAGAPLYDPGSGPDYIRASAKVHHYVWLRIDGDTMTLWAYDRDNNLLDTMQTGYRQEIKAPPPELNFTRTLPTGSMTPGEEIIIEVRDEDGTITSYDLYTEPVALSNSSAKSAAPGLTGSGSRFSDNVEPGATARFHLPVEEKGKYLISLTVPSSASINAPNSLFELESPGQELIRGRVALTPEVMGDKWHDLGLFDLAPGATLTLIEVEDEPGRFYADSVKITPYD